MNRLVSAADEVRGVALPNGLVLSVYGEFTEAVVSEETFALLADVIDDGLLADGGDTADEVTPGPEEPGSGTASADSDSLYLLAQDTILTDGDPHLLPVTVHPDHPDPPSWYNSTTKHLDDGQYVAIGNIAFVGDVPGAGDVACSGTAIDPFGFRVHADLSLGDAATVAGKNGSDPLFVASGTTIAAVAQAVAVEPLIPGVSVTTLTDSDGVTSTVLRLLDAPLGSGVTYTVDWGDASGPENFSPEDADDGLVTHDYADGTYDVHVTGDDGFDVTVPDVTIEQASTAAIVTFGSNSFPQIRSTTDVTSGPLVLADWFGQYAFRATLPTTPPLMDSVLLTGAFNDTNPDTTTTNWGDGNTDGPTVVPHTFSHTYADGVYVEVDTKVGVSGGLSTGGGFQIDYQTYPYYDSHFETPTVGGNPILDGEVDVAIAFAITRAPNSPL